MLNAEGAGKVNRSKIYTVTTIRSIAENEPSGSRCVGWFHECDIAIMCLVKDYADLWELGFYPYAVIETVPEGLYPHDMNPLWFAWHDETKGYEPIDRPESQRNIYGYGIG